MRSRSARREVAASRAIAQVLVHRTRLPHGARLPIGLRSSCSIRKCVPRAVRRRSPTSKRTGFVT